MPGCAGVLNGVLMTELGVCAEWCLGVTLLKSDSCNGVFSPPFRGVSTLVSAMMFCASYNIQVYDVTIVRIKLVQNEITQGSQR